MKCPDCRSCVKLSLVSGARYYFCSLCKILYKLEPQFKLKLFSNNMEEIEKFLNKEEADLLRLE